MGKFTEIRKRWRAQAAASQRKITEARIRNCLEPGEELLAHCSAWRDERGHRHSRVLLWLTDRSVICTLTSAAFDRFQEGIDPAILMRFGLIAKVSASEFKEAFPMEIKEAARVRGLLPYAVVLIWTGGGEFLVFYFSKLPTELIAELAKVIESQRTGNLKAAREADESNKLSNLAPKSPGDKH